MHAIPPLSRWAAGLLLALAATASIAHEGHEHGAMAGKTAAKPQLATTAAFDQAGHLWVTWAEGQHVVIASSDDLGKTLSKPQRINPQPEPIYTDGENRPKVVASPDGALYVSWSRPLDAPYTGFVRFSRSLDGGKTWSAPVTVHHDRQPITHRFDSIAVDGAGRIFMTWIDKRDLLRAQAAKQPYDGAAVYYTVSTDRGATFAPERKVQDQVCECCRIALAPDADGHMLALWRNGRQRDRGDASIVAQRLRRADPRPCGDDTAGRSHGADGHARDLLRMACRCVSAPRSGAGRRARRRAPHGVVLGDAGQAGPFL